MNNMYGNPMGFMGGMVPNQQPMPKTGNWLNGDKFNLLQKGLSQFKLSVTEEELARGQCNHYNLNGTSALIPDQDGSGGSTCAICGTHFTSRDFTQEDVENATQNILDILNTIKILYLSIDPSAALEYFQIIPFIEKIPQLYNIAVADFKRYEGVNNMVPAQNGNQNPFNIFSMMTMGYNPGMMGGYPQQPPMAGYQGYPQQGAPVTGYPPQGAPTMNGFAQQNPGFNPMYGAPVAPQQTPAGYQPQTQGYTFNPTGAAQQPMVNTNMPVQPQQTPVAPPITPQPPAATDPNNGVKVDTEFKK